jgi:hypothetical protein
LEDKRAFAIVYATAADRMAKKRRVYQPRVFDGRIIMPDEIERIPR